MAGTVSYPEDTIVYITDRIGNQGWQASGVLIAPDEVLTAAHVVYSSTAGAANDITVTPAYDAGAAPDGSASGTAIHYFPIQNPGDSITNAQSQNDVAVIHLSHPFTGIGTMALDPNFTGGSATVGGYPAAAGGQLETTQEVFTQDPNYSLLDGGALGEGSSGGPVWITDSQGTPEVVGIVSSLAAGSGNSGFFTQLTPGVCNQIKAWVSADDGGSSTNPLTVLDTTKQTTVAATAAAYAGPVAGLENQYVNITTDGLNISTATPNWFINTGGGNDSINVSQGNGDNVLDGGGGSNFLTGGAGLDTFYLDDRKPTQPAWSTVVNFHPGDGVTIWGVTPSDFTTTILDGKGAANYTGVTIVFSTAGTPASAITLAGYGSGNLTDGRLNVSYGSTNATGSVPGSPYMHIQAA